MAIEAKNAEIKRFRAELDSMLEVMLKLRQAKHRHAHRSVGDGAYGGYAAHPPAPPVY